MARKYFDAKGNAIEVEEPKVDVPARKYFDVHGKPIEIREPLSPPPTPNSPADYSKLVHGDADKKTDMESMGAVINDGLNQNASLKDQFVDSLPVLGGIAGSFASPGPGTALGSFSGDLIRKMMQQQRLPSGGEIAGSAITSIPDAFTGVAGESLATTQPLLRAKLAKMMFARGSGNAAKVAERDAALQMVSGANPSVGQMTGSRVASFMENNFAPSASRELKNGSMEAVGREFENLTPGTMETRAGSVRDALKVGKNQLENKIGNADASLRALGNHNTVSYDIVTGQEPSGLFDANGNAILKDVVENKKIQGPIYLSNTVRDADAFLAGMRRNYGAKSNVALVDLPALPESERKLVNLAQNISDTKSTDPIKNWNGPIAEQISSSGVHPINLDTALEWKTSTGELGFKKPIGGNNIQRLWKNLNRSLDSDISTSIPNWQGGQQANQFYGTRNALNAQRQSLYISKAPATKGLLESSGITSGTGDIQEILSDPVKLGKALAGSSNRETTRQDLLGSWIENVYSNAKSYDEKALTTKFDSAGPMNAFLDPKNEKILNRLLPNAQDKQNLGQFFKSVAVLNPGEQMSNSLAIRAARNASYIAMPLLSGAYSSGLGVGIAGIEIGLNQFTKRVLLNPEVARLIPRLSSLPSSSPEGRAISRLIFTALKGTEVSLTDEKGNKTGIATFGEKGDLIPASR